MTALPASSISTLGESWLKDWRRLTRNWPPSGVPLASKRRAKMPLPLLSRPAQTTMKLPAASMAMSGVASSPVFRLLTVKVLPSGSQSDENRRAEIW